LYSKYNKLPEKKLIKINRILQFIAIFFQGFENQGTCNEITMYVPCLIGASLVASGAGGANDSVHNGDDRVFFVLGRGTEVPQCLTKK
jgi:hypothetical protein